MGGGSSRGLLEKEQSKPIDASDIRNGDWETAKKEVIRLRELISLVDPGILSDGGRSQDYLIQDTGAPSFRGISSAQGLPASSSSARALVRTPPKVVRPTYEIPVAKEGEESTTNNESREGRDYWRDPMGTASTNLQYTNKPTLELPTGEDRLSNLESREGRALWQDIAGKGNSPGTARSDQFAYALNSDRAYSEMSVGSRASTASPQKKKENRLLAQIQDKTFQRFDNMQQAFLKFDYDRSGFVSREEFRVAMATIGLPMTDEEFDILNESYPHQEGYNEEDKGISYLEFIRIMTGQLKYVPGSGQGEDDNYYGRTAANTAYPTSPSVSSPSRPFTSSASSTFSSSSNVDRDKLARMQDVFSKKIFTKFNGMKQAFKAADKDKSGFVEVNELAHLLRHHLELEADDDEVFELLALFDTNGDGRLAYAEFGWGHSNYEYDHLLFAKNSSFFESWNSLVEIIVYKIMACLFLRNQIWVSLTMSTTVSLPFNLLALQPSPFHAESLIIANKSTPYLAKGNPAVQFKQSIAMSEDGVDAMRFLASIICLGNRYLIGLKYIIDVNANVGDELQLYKLLEL
eukprot:gene3529-7022_t